MRFPYNGLTFKGQNLPKEYHIKGEWKPQYTHISLAGYMLNWLHSGGVSHDRATLWHNTLHSLSHNMYYGIDGGSKHRPSHWSIHEYSGTSYSFKHTLNSFLILSILCIII